MESGSLIGICSFSRRGVKTQQLFFQGVKLSSSFSRGGGCSSSAALFPGGGVKAQAA